MKKGRDWIDDSENIWSSLIKTSRQELHQFWELVYNPYYDDCNDYDIDWEYCDYGEYYWDWVTDWVSVNYPSDGLLPQYTQELQGVPEGNRYQVNGANHLEVRNMTTDGNGVDETKDVFTLIFDRNDWFNTN